MSCVGKILARGWMKRRCPCIPTWSPGWWAEAAPGGGPGQRCGVERSLPGSDGCDAPWCICRPSAHLPGSWWLSWVALRVPARALWN